ncbi:WS/DGAT/MGAT family O-acyltransferase [Nocardioides litoris]|uniref:WS/DGAT/MGAT family O-acyltransferase n=1 Tax=Nocardioides litoris TaxID=1926648 RepID=UPI001122C098|nr:wax ester/triacylglycerol synthase family O-acyltransferase [Nocardioides litoris]
MDRLSGLDASFLYLETPAQLMHVCGVIVIDPSTMPTPYTFDALQAGIERQVRDVPEFTRKLRRVPLGLDHPIWVRDRTFDVERHVHRLAVPSPGGYDEMARLVAHLASLPLDRSRPLWEMWVIEGYRDDQLVVFFKMHHSTVDGVSGASLVSHLCSLSPDEAPLALGGSQEHGRAVSRGELLVRGLASRTALPVHAARVVAPTVKGVVSSARRAAQGTAMAAPLTAPRTSFNGTITGHRSIALADMDLAEVRAVKKATGTTVNDVVLAVTGGALRAYLDERGELPDSTLIASVPVSVRDVSKRSGGSNKVSTLFARLGTDIEDPLERLEAMAGWNRNAKDHHQAISADSLQDWAEFAAPRTFGLAVRAYAGLRLAEKHPPAINLVVSNVPGPPVPIYFLGGHVLALYPLGPIFHSAGLNITVMSNDGKVHVGAIACRESVPDADALVRHFPTELARVRDAVAAAAPTVGERVPD